ncbi:hypothetical protein RCV38_06985, partial [Escherichia coli]|nr:hypothetical protein [Escherichia coli]
MRTYGFHAAQAFLLFRRGKYKDKEFLCPDNFSYSCIIICYLYPYYKVVYYLAVKQLILFAAAMLFCCQGGAWFYAFERLYFGCVLGYRNISSSV